TSSSGFRSRLSQRHGLGRTSATALRSPSTASSYSAPGSPTGSLSAPLSLPTDLSRVSLERSGETQRATSHSSPIWWRLPSHRPSRVYRSASTLLSRSHGSCPTAGWNACSHRLHAAATDRRPTSVGRGGLRVRHILGGRGEEPYWLVRRA